MRSGSTAAEASLKFQLSPQNPAGAAHNLTSFLLLLMWGSNYPAPGIMLFLIIAIALLRNDQASAVFRLCCAESSSKG